MSFVAGKTICFSGTLATQTRAQASKAAKKMGAKVVSSISKSTDILVVGKGAGSKEKTAQEKGIVIWTEDKFLESIKESEEAPKKTSAKRKKKTELHDSPPAKKVKALATPEKKTTTKIQPATPAKPGARDQRSVMSIVTNGNAYQVYQDYDVKLMLSDSLNANSNKFYKLQLLVQKEKPFSFYVATNWGRLGEPGKSQVKGPFNDCIGIKEFSKVFRSKTKNSWGEHPFVKYDGKYQLVETTIDDGEGDDDTLGRLTEAQINKGQEVLQKLRSALQKPPKNANLVGTLSNDFYSLIPTKSGRQKPPRLDNLEIIMEKEGLLEFWLRMGFDDVSGGKNHGSPIEGVGDLAVPKSLFAAASNITDKGSISSCISRAEQLVSVDAGNPRTKMNPDLYGAILLYTGNSIYREINRCLRLDWKKVPMYWNYLRLYFEATECFSFQPRTLWRGIAADLFDEYEEGKIITWWSISSCTSSKDVAENFMNQLGTDATLLTIHSKTACDISQLSFYPHEQESLLRPGTKLEVMRRKRNGNVVEIEVKEVEE